MKNNLLIRIHRLFASNKGLGPRCALADPPSSPDVSSSVYINLEANSFVNLFIRDLHPSGNSDALPPSVRTDGHLAFTRGPRHTIPIILHPNKPPRIRLAVEQASA